jgi:hypothetical protein
MSWTLCTSGQCIAKAGANSNTTVIASGSILQAWSDQAEGKINSDTRHDWVSDYANVSANFKPILADAVSSLVAMNIINYDMSGYTGLLEASTMLDVHYDQYKASVGILSKKENQEKLT